MSDPGNSNGGTPAADVVLRTADLVVGYNGVGVAEDLNITVAPGEIVALLGRNGAGKTTTLQTIAGLQPPIQGTVELHGRPASGPLHRRARAGLAFVTETRAVVRKLSVTENLRLGQGSVNDGLELFPELRKLTRRKAGLLSGGEQQMLVLARVLSGRPEVLLVDELSFGLAPLIVRRLLEALQQAARRDNTGILLVEQHPVAALSVADRGYVLGRGRIQLEDTAQALRGRLGEIEETYLSGPVRAA